ncbi:MAG: excinuclease ABC subunit UvrA [Bacteroidia bacterium]
MVLAPIRIYEARQHNLKGVTLDLPRHKLIVFCGLSGSGKSSLAFDTLYAEGFRSYTESLDAYVRQFLPKMPKANVAKIEGLAPSIALAQQKATSTIHSTVATFSELYPYLRLLFGHIGVLHSPLTDQPIRSYSPQDVEDFISRQPAGTRVYIQIPLLPPPHRTMREELELWLAKGFTRVIAKEQVYEIEEVLDAPPKNAAILVGRFRVPPSPDPVWLENLREAIHTAWQEMFGSCEIEIAGKGTFYFSENLVAQGQVFQKPSPKLFDFFSSYGACPVCKGSGKSLGLAETHVVPDPRQPVKDALLLLKKPDMASYREKFFHAIAGKIPLDKPYYLLTPEEKNFLWHGQGTFGGLQGIVKEIEKTGSSTLLRNLSTFFDKTACPACGGTRLQPQAHWVKIAGTSLPQLLPKSISQLGMWLRNLSLSEREEKIAAPLHKELSQRIHFLEKVGVGYLELHRETQTLSGGEIQRINLASILGSSLTGAIYVLDEPTIGLHPHNTQNLIEALYELRDLQNTVVVVEHDDQVILSADHIVEMGPMAGEKGGEVIFQGTPNQLREASTPTAQALQRPLKFAPPPTKQVFLFLEDACLHNLKNISVRFLWQGINVITGVSGSGKSTLMEVLYYALREYLYGDRSPYAPLQIYGRLVLPPSLATAQIGIEKVGQEGLHITSRSIVGTFIGVWDEIRRVFAKKALRPPTLDPHISVEGLLSFNSLGACPTCNGTGELVKSMQFLPDLRLPCPACQGSGYKPEALQLYYREKNIADVLRMTLTEAEAFFADHPKIAERLQVLGEIGLGYLHIGQRMTELSGGELQRLKLASFLLDESPVTPIFLFDEPTTGLHPWDVTRLMETFYALRKKGHTLIFIEHNVDAIAGADWVIDLGPQGGEKGGELLFEGHPRQLIQNHVSYTAQAIRQRLG